MSVTRLYSADIYVHDLDTAVDFYVSKLGFEKRVDEPVDEEGHRWVEVAPKGSETAVILSHAFGSWATEKVGGWSRRPSPWTTWLAPSRPSRRKGWSSRTSPKSSPTAPTRRSGIRTATSSGCSKRRTGERLGSAAWRATGRRFLTPTSS